MDHHAHTEHVHGTMDVRDHEKTFAGFIKFVTWTSVIIAFVLVFLALANS